MTDTVTDQIKNYQPTGRKPGRPPKDPSERRKRTQVMLDPAAQKVVDILRKRYSLSASGAVNYLARVGAVETIHAIKRGDTIDPRKEAKVRRAPRPTGAPTDAS